MALINGDDKILYLYIDPDWIPIGCVTDHSFSETVDLLPINIDQWAASVPTNQGYEITFTGIQIVSITGTHSYDELKLIKRAKTLIQWRIDDEEGYGFITSIGEAAPAGDFLTFDGVILGFGIPTVLTGDIWSDGEGILWSNGESMIFS